MPLYSKEVISQLVKDSRITKGYTQQQLADFAGISLRSVQRIENGEVLPRLYTLKILAAHLNFPVEELTALSPPAVTGKVPGLNRPRKIILSVGLLILMVLFTTAFLAQSSKFPETDFERFLLYFAITACYTLALFRIWK